MNRFIPQQTTLEILAAIRQRGLRWHYDREKHRIIIPDETGQEKLILRLPLPLPEPDENLQLPPAPVHYVILLVQSGSCALGYFENGRNLDHKVFRAYMVRKKRGVSQLKHLKTKGKSRAGSRVRLGETEEFFAQINERLRAYFGAHRIDRVALSVSKILMPHLFEAKHKTPFDQRDPRLFKIPKHVHLPIYEVLLDTHKFLQKGELIYEEKHQAFVDSLLPPLT